MKYLAILFFPLALGAQTIPGLIDVHVHADPDSRPRPVDAIDVAKMAQSAGMRAVVFKNHYEATSGLAYLVRKVVPGVEIYGGIVLNLTVGGMNAAAVEEMASVKGGFGRVVWMPTSDAEYAVRRAKENRPFVRVALDGQVTAEVKEVLAVIAKRKLTLATGHIAPEESLIIIREARSLGIDRIIVTHAMVQDMTVPQMKEAAKMGAFVEFVYNQIVSGRQKMEDYSAAIRAVGPEHCIASTDLATPGSPLQTAGFAAYIAAFREQGFTQAEIDQMTKKNPAALLGLP